MSSINKLSKLMGPFSFECSQQALGKSIVSKSHKLFLELGLVHFTDGMGTLLPLVVRSLRKLKKIIRQEMSEISALEISLPTLTHSELFKKSGRIKISELYKLKDRNHREYVLSPTHEEAVTSLVALSSTFAFNQLPLRLYQISNKFRDEKRTKSGLLRSKEFVMKDLYCFDSSLELSENSYKEIVNKYFNIFELLKVPFVCVNGSTGDIGGLKSDEFHFLSDAGEDLLVLCQDCGHNINSNIDCTFDKKSCLKCHSTNITIKRGIEVGHAFSLGTTYTEPFEATFKDVNACAQLLYMSCFGLGLSRILGAAVEALCTPTELKWPVALAPYLVCILPPKAGSKEEDIFGNHTESIYRNLNEQLVDDVVLDDRKHLTIGKRLTTVKKLGFPFLMVAGKSVLNDPPCVEIHDTNTGSVDFVHIPDINQFILSKLSGSRDKLLREQLSLKN